LLSIAESQWGCGAIADLRAATAVKAEAVGDAVGDVLQRYADWLP
jgi:hypothetical protein